MVKVEERGVKLTIIAEYFGGRADTRLALQRRLGRVAGDEFRVVHLNLHNIGRREKSILVWLVVLVGLIS